MEWYTEDIGKFGSREISMLADIFKAWCDKGLPDDFENDNVRPAMNLSSGYVFLVNDEAQVAMLNDDRLESWYSTPYEGHEGFLSDLLDVYSDMHPEDKEFVDILKR